MDDNKTIKILHAADFHMDSPFESLDDKKARLRRAEQRELPLKIAEAARRLKADIILLAGDLLDSECTYRETADTLINALASIDMPVFISPGNHDYYARHSPYARFSFPENVHIFTKPEPECVPLPSLGARVWGAAFTEAHSGPLLRGFSPEKNPGLLDIMVVHGDYGVKDSPYNPISDEDIASAGMDYIALGHIHSFSEPRSIGKRSFAWPGCPEGRGFDETGEKGIIFAELSARDCRVRFVPLGGRRYEHIEIDLTESESFLLSVKKALSGDTSRDIYRIVLRGECAAPPDLKALHAELDDAFFQLELRDKTTLRRDIWQSFGEDTLRGLFVSKLKKLYDSASDEAERELVVLAARRGIAALDNEEDAL